MKHTSTPWIAVESEDGLSLEIVPMNVTISKPIATGLSKEDALRIVECVNAFEDVEDPSLWKSNAELIVSHLTPAKLRLLGLFSSPQKVEGGGQ